MAASHLRTEGRSARVPFEVPTAPPPRFPTTKSSAVVIFASPAALQSAPPAELDGQVEEAMDYSPITDVVAPDFPPEQWPEGPGPLGF
jgi:hypothetical protein